MTEVRLVSWPKTEDNICGVLSARKEQDFSLKAQTLILLNVIHLYTTYTIQ